MNFDLEGIVDSAKGKAVDAVTEKLGGAGSPIADAAKEVMARKMGIHSQENDNSSGDSSGDNSSDDSNS